MKALAVAAVWLVLQPAAESTFQYNVSMNGGNAGTATITIRELPENRRQVQLTMDLKVGSSEARVRQEAIYEADGAASRKILEQVSGRNRTLKVAELSDKGAKLTLTEAGKTTTKTVPLSDKAPRSNPSNYWFSRTKPKVGDRISYYAFDVNDEQWRLETTLYRGKKDATLAGKRASAHEIITTRGGVEVVTLVDDQGVPIEMTNGPAMRIVRSK